MCDEAECKEHVPGDERARDMAVDYYIGLVEFQPREYRDMDRDVLRILREARIHLKPGNMERLYMPRQQMGRGLTNILFKSERMLLEMYNFLDHRKGFSMRRAAILAVERKRATHLGTIKSYLKEKYNLGEVEKEALVEKQKKSLEEKTNLKVLHRQVLQSLGTQGRYKRVLVVVDLRDLSLRRRQRTATCRTATSSTPSWGQSSATVGKHRRP